MAMLASSSLETSPHIEAVTEFTPEVAEALRRLLPELSQSAPLPTESEVRALVESAATTLFVARTPAGRIVGTLTLAVFRIPSGVRAWIEDVIVSEEARGQGVGALLTEAALQAAQALGAITVDLTSRPSREAANRLYERCGFDLRDTNVYRFKL
jgi:ribosomal protein S18 acetylase RimI-like enzyme